MYCISLKFHYGLLAIDYRLKFKCHKGCKTAKMSLIYFFIG